MKKLRCSAVICAFSYCVCVIHCLPKRRLILIHRITGESSNLHQYFVYKFVRTNFYMYDLTVNCRKKSFAFIDSLDVPLALTNQVFTFLRHADISIVCRKAIYFIHIFVVWLIQTVIMDVPCQALFRGAACPP